MALFLEHAQYLQLPDLQTAVLEAIITQDDLFNVIDFQNVAPYTRVEYTRELTLGSVDAAWIATTGTVTESAPLGTHVSDDVKILMAAVKIPRVNLGTPAEGWAIASKAKQVTRKFIYSALSGQDRTSTEAAGLSSLVKAVAAQTLSAQNGTFCGNLTEGDMDSLYDKVNQYRTPSFFLGSARTVNAYRALLRSSGGIGPLEKQVANFGSPQLTFRNVPVLSSEWIPNTEILTAIGGGGPSSSAQCSSLYAVYSNFQDGYGCFFNGPNVIDVIGPINVTLADQVEYQIIMRVGTVLKTGYAAAVLRGITA